MKHLTVSIVIPVYNEAAHLGACLDAIARQSVRPAQVIVVENNSSDGTSDIARRYPFVTLLQESRQGVVFARNTGFDAVRSDIIGRIDADTIVATDWVASVRTLFATDTVDAVSGAVAYHDLPCFNLFAKLDLHFRQGIARRMGEEVFLYGANMAIRRQTWQLISDQLCLSGGLHEDFDVGIHAQQSGAHVIFDKRLQAAVSLRRFDTDLADFWQYVWLNPKTYALHGRTSQRHMYPVIVLVMLSYGAIKVMHRCYDPERSRFSWNKLWRPLAQVRVNPATFVD